MQIRSESVLHHPLDLVYRTYRDRLTEIAAFIPDVREVRVLSREEIPGGVRLLNLWISSREVPRIAASVLTPDKLQWEDHATWRDADHAVDWRMVFPAFPDRVRCEGTNWYIADGPSRTRVRIEGELRIELRRIPGVPDFLARSAGPAVERFIVELVTPNLVRVNESLEKFLDTMR